MSGTVVKQAGPLSYEVKTEEGFQRTHGDEFEVSYSRSNNGT